MGPVSTGLGEIYLWTVETETGAKKPDGTPYTPTDLREIQDWIIKPQLRNVTGVTEINPSAATPEYQVAPDPEKLAAYGMTCRTWSRRWSATTPTSAPATSSGRRAVLIRAPGQASIDDIANIIVANVQGVPSASATWPRWAGPRAAHRRGHRQRPRSGAGHGLHADRREQPHRRRPSTSAWRRSTAAAAGVQAVTVYDRTVLVDKAIATVKKNLLEGAAGDRDPVPVPRQHPRGRDHGHGDSAVHAVHLHGHGAQGQRQPDEPGGAGLRHHHRRRGGDRGELRAPPGPCAAADGR
jgi:cobalt-zinc-cadmium resistance protein CzcA